MLQHLAFCALKPFIKEIKGLHNIPKTCIIASNHASYIDGPLIYLIHRHYTKKPVHFIMATRIPTKNSYISFEKGWKRYMVETILQQIMTGGAVNKARDRLGKNQTIGIFPEGRRTKTGSLGQTTHTGLGIIHLLTKTPIVPVALKGTFEWWPYNKTLPDFTKCISIIIGKPKTFKKALSRKNALEIQKEIMMEIQRMMED